MKWFIPQGETDTDRCTCMDTGTRTCMGTDTDTGMNVCYDMHSDKIVLFFSFPFVLPLHRKNCLTFVFFYYSF